jgi:hypothetical protein
MMTQIAFQDLPYTPARKSGQNLNPLYQPGPDEDEMEL